MEKDQVIRAGISRCPLPVYPTHDNTDSCLAEATAPWFHALLNSTLSTTRYLSDHYTNVEFRVVGQTEPGGHIFRVSEFLQGGRVIVHSTVDIPIGDNPVAFVEAMRAQAVPIGDALRDNGYRVEREILHHDASSKVYAMRGDVNLTITEQYYIM